MRSGRLDVSMALTLGTPVIASDIATFQEITQSCALLLSPLDECGGKRQRADIMVSVVSVIETLSAARRREAVFRSFTTKQASNSLIRTCYVPSCSFFFCSIFAEWYRRRISLRSTEGFGICSFISSSVSMRMLEMARSRNHL